MREEIRITKGKFEREKCEMRPRGAHQFAGIPIWAKRVSEKPENG
jgi:hypothetical protein